MNRFVVTFPSTLDALRCDRALREKGLHSSFVPLRRTSDEAPSTVALEIEAESEPQIREVAGRFGAAILDVKTLP